MSRVLLLAITLGACGSEGGGANVKGTPALGGAPTLQGRTLTDTLSLGLPMAILEVGGRIVVQDAATAHALHLFDGEGQLIGSGGREGAGPGEFVDPSDAFARPGHPDEVWVYDSRLGRVTRFDVAVLASGAALRGSRASLALSPALVVESPRWLDDSTLVALDPMMSPGGRRFALFGPDGTLRRAVGDPPPGSDRVSPFVRQQAYGGLMAVHPERPLFALASRHAGRMEVFDRNGGLHARMRVPDAFEPDFTPARDGVNMIRGPDFRFGYVDVAATREHVLGLFSGRRFEGGRDDQSYLGDQIHVFDWDGRFLGALGLDRAAFRIAVNPGGARLYALRHDPYPQAFEYRLDGAGLQKLARR